NDGTFALFGLLAPIKAVVTNVNACENDLLNSLINQPPHFLENLLLLHAPAGAPSVRNKAIGAKTIATILDLQKGAGLVGVGMNFFKGRLKVPLAVLAHRF